MPKDLIRYDLLVQDALKGVVRKVLADAAREGLPGDHHFYVSFRTRDPGTRVSSHLRERYPDEMTVVLQHQFWDLSVNDVGFEVGLSFSGRPERLVVPYDAITGFFDPSVQFGLKFDVRDEAPASEVPPRPEPSAAPSRPSKTQGKQAASPPAALPTNAGPKPVPPAEPQPAARERKAKGAKLQLATEDSAEVVSLDAFRKKP